MPVWVSTRGRNLFPSVLLHPPSLAFEFSASYGEMSRRSGDLSVVARSAEMDAAEADNHSDISLLSINDLRAVGHQISDALWNSCLVDITFESSRLRTARSSPCCGKCGRPRNLSKSLTHAETRMRQVRSRAGATTAVLVPDRSHVLGA